MSYSTCVAGAMRLVAIGNLQSDDLTCNPHAFPVPLLDLIVAQILWPTRTFGTYNLKPVLPIPSGCICRMTCSRGQNALRRSSYATAAPQKPLFLGTFTSKKKTKSHDLHRSQIEPALAILCACIMTLRPLLADLHLHVFRLSTRFTRGKSISSSSNTTSTDCTKETPSNFQWPGIRTFSQKNSAKLSSRVTSPNPSLQTVTVNVETKDQKGVYAQVSELGSKDSTDG